MESVHSPRIGWPTLPIPAACAALAVTSLATSGIHFAVMGEHFDEYFVFGLFFSIVAWLQALWALGVVVAPTRPLLAVGLVGNAVVMAVWVVTRTTGLPIGPEQGTPEPAAFLDVLSVILEAGIVVGTVVLLVRRRPPGVARTGRVSSLLVVVLGLALAFLTTAAVASGAQAEGGHGGGEEASDGNRAADGAPLARIDLGGGRVLQAVVDGSGGAAQMHLTFFDAQGGALEVDSVSVTGVSAAGDRTSVPVELFEAGHYAATLDLESGEWEFDVEGSGVDGGDFTASFDAEVP